MKFRIAAVVTVILSAASSSATADDLSTTIYSPQNEVEKAAAATLDKHCSRCHQDGKLTNRQKPAKALGNILQLDQIASNPSLIQPGNPEGSRIIQQIVNKDMPYDVYQEGSASQPSPTEDEVTALRNWIAGLKPQCSVASVSVNSMIDAMVLIGAQ